MKTEWTKLSQHKQENIYGGWAWLVALMPFLIQSVTTAVSSIKMLQTDNGAIKYNGMQAEWSTNKASSDRGKIKEYFYAL